MLSAENIELLLTNKAFIWVFVRDPFCGWTIINKSSSSSTGSCCEEVSWRWWLYYNVTIRTVLSQVDTSCTIEASLFLNKEVRAWYLESFLCLALTLMSVVMIQRFLLLIHYKLGWIIDHRYVSGIWLQVICNTFLLILKGCIFNMILWWIFSLNWRRGKISCTDYIRLREIIRAFQRSLDARGTSSSSTW